MPVVTYLLLLIGGSGRGGGASRLQQRHRRSRAAAREHDDHDAKKKDHHERWKAVDLHDWKATTGIFLGAESKSLWIDFYELYRSALGKRFVTP